MQPYSNAASIISLVPFGIAEFKPGLYPGRFVIPAAPENGISIVCIGILKKRDDDPGYTTPVHHFYIDVTRGSLTIKQDPFEVADSVVRDFLDAQLGTTDDARPGIFAVRGEFDAETAAKTFKTEIFEARKTQFRWFQELVKIADDLWSKYQQRRAISDIQIFAARALKYTRPWMEEAVVTGETPICPACGSFYKAGIALCPSCHCVVDPEKAKNLQFIK